MCVLLCVCFLTAPSVVPIMHQVSSTSHSFSLSWPPPEQPNGIILDYEIRYFDKVQWDDKFLSVCVCFGVMVTDNNPLESIKWANQYQLWVIYYQDSLRSSDSLTASQITWIKVKKKSCTLAYLWHVYLRCVFVRFTITYAQINGLQSEDHRKIGQLVN